MVEDATLNDLDEIMCLWAEFSIELNTTYPHSDVPHTPHNQTQYAHLFRMYIEGAIDGTLTVWRPHPGAPIGGVGAGGAGIPGPVRFHERWKKPAWVWGIYVKPEFRNRGAWRALYRHGRTALRALGFSHILGHVLAGNSTSYRIGVFSGSKPYAILLEQEL